MSSERKHFQMELDIPSGEATDRLTAMEWEGVQITRLGDGRIGIAGEATDDQATEIRAAASAYQRPYGKLKVKLNGPGVAAQRVRAAELGAFLVNLNAVFNQSVLAIGGGDIELEVRDVEHGSFEVAFEAVSNVVAGFKDLQITATAMLGLLFGRAGAIALIKNLNNRPYSAEEVDGGNVAFSVEGEDAVEIMVVPKDVARIVGDRMVRRRLDSLITKLPGKQITSVQFSAEGQHDVLVKGHSEFSAFMTTPVEPRKSVQTMALQIRALSFDSKKSWTFESSGRTFKARVLDGEFWEMVHSNQKAFSEGDSLVAEVEVEQRMEEPLPKPKYTVFKVQKHTRAVKQLELAVPGKV